MKVEDITHLHRELVSIAKKLGAQHPEDIVQDLWIKLLDIESKEGSLDRLSYQGTDINKAYLSLIIRNAVIDESRSEKNMIRLEDEYDLLDPSSEYVDDRLAGIEEAVAYLTRTERLLLLEYILYESNEAAIARETGVSQSTLHRRLKRIKEKVKKSYYLVH